MDTRFKAPDPAFFRDFAWLRAHHTELVRDYAGLWVAAADGRVVASGASAVEVEGRAIAEVGAREVPVMFIDTGKHLYGQAVL